MPGRYVSLSFESSKLCHRIELLSFSTRFPESKSCKRAELSPVDLVSVDQTFLSSSNKIRFPSEVKLKDAMDLLTDSFLLAIHTTVPSCGVRLQYQIPKYPFAGLLSRLKEAQLEQVISRRCQVLVIQK
ncbi:hypothetical protein ZIOFF_025170 [Zingiber officinale]|uniref:Uncharacterized protein n=1 Tax=Zingiber officinale TaxID=94328 RepID=A0A8J5GXE6_ZINOF|nr:hypothetical protein ZIOFF_025170 [Zingiber officinale]